MDRRAVLLLAATASLAHSTPLPACATNRRCRVVVVLYRIPVAEVQGPGANDPATSAFREALRDLGWKEGNNLELLWRSAQGSPARMGQIIDELVALPAHLVVVTGNVGAQEALKRTRTIPIVMTQSTTPVGLGLVASVERPGGNLTGMVGFRDLELYGKRLSLLKEADPRVSRVAFMTSYNIQPTGWEYAKGIEDEARAQGLTIFPVRLDGPEDVDRAFHEAIDRGANGVYFDSSLAASRVYQPTVSALATRHRLPVVYPFLKAAEWGGLLAYDRDDVVAWKRAARFVDRILRGEDPGTIPLEQAATMRLSINLAVASALGLVIPRSLLRQANRLVE